VFSGGQPLISKSALVTMAWNLAMGGPGKKIAVHRRSDCRGSGRASRATDILDVARAHQHTAARRNGEWEFLESPKLRRAKQEIRNLSGALEILSKPFPAHESLTPQERVALAQFVRGASSKEAVRMLGISPRTVEFHRANVMRKLGAKNIADLVRKVLGQ
jgi:DNA-binding CsgD family transcriptional regulator